MEVEDIDTGAEIGAAAGILGGLSALVNPLLATPVIIATIAGAMGVFGAITGAALGGYIGDELDTRRFPPVRAKIYKDRVHSGEVLVSVLAPIKEEKNVKAIFQKHHAAFVESVLAKE